MITINLIAAHARQVRACGTFDLKIEGTAGQSLMQAAVAANVQGIDADCGGLMICGTCHVFVREPHASALPPPDADELGLLDFTATPRQANSRLACQITLTQALDGMVVDVPDSQH